jgi:Alw26I/Eco31I/Esp3I family type II restriction m6 adenine DNA methyltransferase
MQHVVTATAASPRHDLRLRLEGRFYTAPVVAAMLATDVLSFGGSPRSIGDPFCGDGRLVVAWLRGAAAAGGAALQRLRRIVLWDCDADAVAVARANVTTMLLSIGCKGRVVVAEAGDSFERAVGNGRSLDLVVTNPPWDLLKPDSRDAVATAARGAYVDSIRAYAERLVGWYPAAASASGKAMTGYGVNLARAGLLAALRLLSHGGRIGIVLPASPFADQASAPFRRELFSAATVRNLRYFPAETKLFKGVDQPFVTLTGTVGGPTEVLTLVRLDDTLRETDRRPISLGPEHDEPLPLVVTGAQADVVTWLAKHHAPMGELEQDGRFGLWLGREVDETNLASVLTSGAVGVPFLKGRYVFPFAVVSHATTRIDPRRRAIPATVGEARFAWRDVSRPTQKRRMHVALVPDGWVTGNSLGVGFLRHGSREMLLALVGVLNSFTFEVQMRARLATAHVSQGVLRRCAVPLDVLGDAARVTELHDLVLRRIDQPDDAAVAARLEICVAQAYGLSRDHFATTLTAFPKFTDDERATLMAAWR